MSSSPSVSPLRVLLVDDDDASVYTYARLLRGAGLDVVACRSATEARAHAEREHFDVVVVDYWMPEMNGAQLLASVRATLGPRTPPFLLVTAMAAPIPAVQRARFAAVLEKPFSFSSLRRAIAMLTAGDELVRS
ncbi:response regulator [Sandaracinus amylolyticus]|uniref:Chemotaxis protein cheY n=1 Tax=Sandaracinus amylolyticus TaxID=927083 RepID=A0A0F6YIH4_9BACT|nr:response regulator [Sandaracinus amylolyticus]AKF05128.1 Chemotaxis protein cheY [Sandaracinus amylolyticus]